MDFKQTVMSDADDKYKDMFNSSTAKPFTSSTSFDNYADYEKKRNGYITRLTQERDGYNQFLTSIRTNRDNRLKKKKDIKKYKGYDRGLFLGSIIVVISFIVLIMAFMFVSSNSNVSDWVAKYYTQYNFKTLVNGSMTFPNAETVMTVIGIISLVVAVITFSTIGIIGAIIVFVVLAVLLAGLVAVSSYILVFMLSPLMPVLLGIIAIVLLIIFSCKFCLTRNIVINISYCIFVFIVMIVVMILASNASFQAPISVIIADVLKAIKSSF